MHIYMHVYTYMYIDIERERYHVRSWCKVAQKPRKASPSLQDSVSQLEALVEDGQSMGRCRVGLECAFSIWLYRESPWKIVALFGCPCDKDRGLAVRALPFWASIVS